MKVELKPEHQELIDPAIRSGAFQDAEHVVDHAFGVIREELETEDWLMTQRDTIAAHIAAGYEQAQRGELIPGDEVIARLRRRREERQASRR
jgi:predicted transcriptional regulator